MSDGALAVAATLGEREKTYGCYRVQARTAVALKDAMHAAPGWQGLPSDMKESLDLIATKISRVLHGNPEHADNWHDIAGYALLIEERLKAG